MLRLYPTNAPRGGSTTLGGGGSASDEFLFSDLCKIVLENNTAAAVELTVGIGNSSVSGVSGGSGSDAVAATRGDLVVPAGGSYESDEEARSISLYGAAGTAVNGTSGSGLVLYGLLT